MIGSASDRACPEDETLAAWIEHRLSAADREVIERHVAACATCADVAAAALAASDRALPARVHDVDADVAAPERPRNVRRRFALAASVFIATAALAYGAVGTVATRARDELTRRAAAALGQPVAIGRLGLGLAPDLDALEIRLIDVRIGGADSPRADEVRVRVPLASLVARAPVVSRLHVDGLVLRLGDGSVASVGSGRVGGDNAVAAALGTAALEIAGGTLIVDVPGAAPLRFEHLAGTSTPEDGRVQLELSAVAAGGTATAEGDIAMDAAGPLSISLAGRGLAAAELPYAHGRLAGTLDVSVRVAGTAAAPTVAGRTLIRDGRALGWNPLARMVAGLGESVRAAAPQFATDDLVFDELRIAFSYTSPGWRIPRLYVTSSNIAAGAVVQIDANQRLTGSGTLRLAPPVASALIGALPAFEKLRADDLSVTLPIGIGGTADAPSITLAPNLVATPPTASPGSASD